MAAAAALPRCVLGKCMDGADGIIVGTRSPGAAAYAPPPAPLPAAAEAGGKAAPPGGGAAGALGLMPRAVIALTTCAGISAKTSFAKSEPAPAPYAAAGGWSCVVRMCRCARQCGGE